VCLITYGYFFRAGAVLEERVVFCNSLYNLFIINICHQLLLMVCCRHNNFVLVSSLVIQNPLVDRGLLANISEANAKNLETIASLLADLLVCLSTPEDTRLVLFACGSFFLHQLIFFLMSADC